jgi:putative FmdB family regulatory protein
MEVMPLYTYTCLECDKSYEIIKSIEQRDDSVCPDCGIRLIRNIDKPGLVWAPTRGGSGYAT